MLEAKLTIEIPGLLEAADRITKALLSGRSAADAHQTRPTENPPPSAAPQASAYTSPLAAAPPVVPIAESPSYTLEQVSRAGSDLLAADPSKMAELRDLLGRFGARAVTELKPEQLGSFATALRGLGAKL